MNKVIKRLELLSPAEYKKFKLFIKSPFYNKDENLIQLYDKYHNLIKKYKNKEKEYPKGWKEDVQMYNTTSALVRAKTKLIELVEEFMVLGAFDKKEDFKSYLLLNEFNKRGDTKSNIKAYEDIPKGYVGHGNLSNEWLYNQYLLEINQLETLYAIQASQKEKAIQFDKTIRAFNSYLLSNHLWLDNTLIGSREFINDESQDKKITQGLVGESETFVSLAMQVPYSDNPLIKARIIVNEFILNKNDDNFNKLFQIIKDHYNSFSKSVTIQLCRFLVNYCVDKIHKGEYHYHMRIKS